MTRVRKKEMEAVFSPDEVRPGGIWLVAADYRMFGGKIHPIVGKRPGDLLAMPTIPLSDPEVFLSFARLDAHGEPSEAAILAWVRKHGLLRCREPAVAEFRYLPDGSLNQKPESPKDLQVEAKRAHRLLRTFELHRGGDANALRSRVRVRWFPMFGEPRGWAEILLDDRHTGDITPADEALSDEGLLDAVLGALKQEVERRIAAVRPAFAPKGKLALRVPDLLTAMYWQFANLVDGKQFLGICAGCGRTFVKTRIDKQVCRPACRSTKMRRGKKQAQENPTPTST